jgi:hypothetical protein
MITERQCAPFVCTANLQSSLKSLELLPFAAYIGQQAERFRPVLAWTGRRVPRISVLKAVKE